MKQIYSCYRYVFLRMSIPALRWGKISTDANDKSINIGPADDNHLPTANMCMHFVYIIYIYYIYIIYIYYYYFYYIKLLLYYYNYIICISTWLKILRVRTPLNIIAIFCWHCSRLVSVGEKKIEPVYHYRLEYKLSQQAGCSRLM